MRAKLNFGFLAIILLLCGTCAYALWSSQSVHKIFIDLKDDVVPGAIAMAKMKGEANSIAHAIMDYVVTGEPEAKAEVQEASKLLENSLAAYKEHECHIASIVGKRVELEEQGEKLISIANEIIDLKDKQVAEDVLLKKEEEELHSVLYLFLEYVNSHKQGHLEELAAAEAEVQDKHTAQLKYITILGLIAVLLSIFIGVLVDRFFLNFLAERKRTEKVLQKSERALRHLSSKLFTTQEEERKRIARELHDGLGQSLCAIQCSLAAILEHRREEKLSTEVTSLKRSITILEGVIGEAHRISINLRPSMLDDLGLLPTIEAACREFESIHSEIHVEKQIDIREDDLPDSLKIVIYRLLQEALNNIAKHSQADLVHLSLKETDGKIELAIYDNGRGFDLEHVLSVKESRRGLGLTGMKERTELSRGSFSIESSKGSGTTVWASWQYQETNPIAL